MGSEKGTQGLQIRCLDCVRSDDLPHLPLLWNAGVCNECAATSVINHLVEHPGHRCEVLGKSPDDSKTTARLLGKTGW